MEETAASSPVEVLDCSMSTDEESSRVFKYVVASADIALEGLVFFMMIGFQTNFLFALQNEAAVNQLCEDGWKDRN